MLLVSTVRIGTILREKIENKNWQVVEKIFPEIRITDGEIERVIGNTEGYDIARNNMLFKGQRVLIQGNARELWIKKYNDCNIEVYSKGTVLQTDYDKKQKMILVCIDEIGKEKNVNIFVRKNMLKQCI